MDAMPADTPPNRHLIAIGEIYFQWVRNDRHYLALDLSGPLPEWVVDMAGELIPLGEYLARHPGRREEVRQLIRRRLVTPDQEI
jgi:predicted pyridoxine 5'-phosphate oxidase superfamily flavin-nucleotide-binding protein